MEYTEYNVTYPNVITFQEFCTIKQYGNLTKGFEKFQADEIDNIAVFYDKDMVFLDYIERREVEEIHPAFVLLPRFFWEQHLDTLPTEFIPSLQIEGRLAELKEYAKGYWHALSSRMLTEQRPVTCDAEPREEQKPVMDFFIEEMNSKHKVRGVLQAPPGVGKSQPNSEPVLTQNGWVPMGSIKKGDEVIGSDGRPTKVLDVFPQGSRKIYLITFNDGTTVKCDKEHLWTVWKNRDNQHKKYRVMTTQELLDSRYIREEKTKYDTTQKIRMWSVPLCEPVEFKTEYNPIIDGYILGLLLGDGGMTQNRLSFSDKAGNNFNRMKPILEEAFSDFSYRLDSKEKDYDLNSIRLKKELRNLNLFGKKSIHKFIPKDYLTADIITRQKVLWGLLDTDSWKMGDTSNKNSRRSSYEYYTSSKQLAHDFLNLVQGLGIYNSGISINPTPKYTYRGEDKIGQPAYKIIINFNKKRKSIDSIQELDYEEESTCIKVQAEDSLYITRDYTVTHNTFMSIKMTSGFRARSLIIVPNEVLQDQWKDAILQFTDTPENRIGIVQGSDLSKIEKEVDFETKDIIIVKIQSLYSQIKRNPLHAIQGIYKYIDMVFYDECHNSGAATSYAKTSSLFFTPNIIGLSATPYRIGLNDYLLKTSIGKTIYKVTHNNLTPDIEVHNVYVPFTEADTKRVMQVKGDYNMQLGVFGACLKTKDQYFEYLSDVVAFNRSIGHDIVVLFPTIALMEKLMHNLEVRHPLVFEESLLLKGKTKQDAMEMVKEERKILMLEYKEFKEFQDSRVKNKEIKRKDYQVIVKGQRAQIDSKLEYLKEHALDLYKKNVNQSKIIVSNYNLLSAGFDKSSLSNIIFGGAPRIGKISVIQSIGRITRTHDGKLTPLAQYFIPSPFFDINSSTGIILNRNIKVQYEDAKFSYQGFQRT